MFSNGGLVSYVKNGYKVEYLKTLYVTSTIFESLSLEITLPSGKKIAVTNLYKPPRNNTNENISLFLNEFTPLLDKIDNKYECSIFGGDLNIDLLKIFQRELYNDYFELFLHRGFIPLITMPTRFSAQNATLIDHIFVKMKNFPNIFSSILLKKISDHLPTVCALPFSKYHTSKPVFVTQTSVKP